MADMNARKIIEALRSGIPSRAVGRAFTEARQDLLSLELDDLEAVCENDVSKGRIILGRYGEGKTHLLNTVFSLAQDSNMVVSCMSISKESPFDKMPLVYQKLMANTYLPKKEEPGITELLEKLTPNSSAASELTAYAAGQLESDKLYFLLRTYLNDPDQDDRLRLLSDFEGDFISNADLKKSYRLTFKEPAKYRTPFKKTVHMHDYFSFMSYLFRLSGYAGWVILVDEAELMGRLGKKARLKSYGNIEWFLNPEGALKNTYTMFAFASSYEEDVIDRKHELQNLEEAQLENEADIKTAIREITRGKQLNPMSKDEILAICTKIMEMHALAYEWDPGITPEELIRKAGSNGYLLRTRLRSMIEYLDQLYQYGTAEETEIGSLKEESYDSDTVSLEDLDERVSS